MITRKVIVVLFFIFVSGVSGASQYVVTPGGNDSSPGSSALPWKTVQKAANTMVAGDSVIIQAGTYNERVQTSRSGSAGNLITFQAQGTVVMNGFSLQANYVKVDGFEMVATGAGWSDRANGSGVYLAGNNNVISNNYLHHSTAAGIFMTSSASGNTVTGNRIAYAVECGIYINGSNHLIVSNDISHTRSIGGSDADAIRFFGSGTTARKNYIHDMLLSDSPGQSPHIDAFQTWGPAANYIFEQNLIDKTASHQQAFTIEGSAGQQVDNLMIRNNVFITRGSGYQPDVNTGDTFPVSNVSILNNTMVAMNGPVEYAVWIFAAQSGVVVKNNVIYDHGNSGAPYILVQTGSSGVSIASNAVFHTDNQLPTGGCRTGDFCFVNPSVPPGFVNLAAGDFHLQATSPLVNKGVSLTQVTNDFDGVARPQGTAYDIGAYELASGGGPGLPPTAAFTFSPSSPSTGTPISFNGSASTCSASPCTYTWTDDADGSQLGTGVTMSFTFQGVGTKLVRLTVTDTLARTASVEHDVIVSPQTTSPCDINLDQATNSFDVQLEVNQALAVSACTADLNKDTTCNIIDVQRVSNAALNGICVSP